MNVVVNCGVLLHIEKALFELIYNSENVLYGIRSASSPMSGTASRKLEKQERFDRFRHSYPGSLCFKVTYVVVHELEFLPVGYNPCPRSHDALRFSGQASAIFVDRIRQHDTSQTSTGERVNLSASSQA